jgi:phosphonate metabolism protein (transferase hexapeptide repeat family)
VAAQPRAANTKPGLKSAADAGRIASRGVPLILHPPRSIEPAKILVGAHAMATPARPKIAETVIHETVRLREADIGRRCEILQNSRIEFAALGDYSYLGENCDVAGAIIGKFTAIANSVRIGAPNHPMDRPAQHRFTYCPEYYEPSATRDHDFFRNRRAAKVHVGNDCWIGHGAIILPDVIIGDGAVIAAGAVVSRDVPPYTVVAGVPARPLRRRFPEIIAEKLQRIAWWNWPDELIFERLADFRSTSIEEFCDCYDPAGVAAGREIANT